MIPPTRFLLLILLLTSLLSGCSKINSTEVVLSPSLTPILMETQPSFEATQAYLPLIVAVTATADNPYTQAYPGTQSTPTYKPKIDPTPTPTKTIIPSPMPAPTLLALTQPLPAPLYFIGPAGQNKRQVWRLEQDGARLTQITHEEYSVTDLDVARDGRLAYLSNNALIVTDAWGIHRKVFAQGEPLPIWNDQWSEWANNLTLIFKDPRGSKRLVSAKDEARVWNGVLGQKVVDEDFIWLTTPIWSPDSSLIAFGWDAAWLVNPATEELIKVTEQRTDETRGGQLTYVPIGWTPDGKKIILNIMPPRYGHGGEGPNTGLGFVDPQQDSIPINPGTLDCCEYSILKNEKVLLGGTGLWEIDPQTGKEQSLLPEPDPQNYPNFPGMAWPKQAPDGRVYFFTGFGTEAKQITVLAFVDGNKKPIQYSSPKDATWVSKIDLQWVEQALWSANAEMVILIGYDYSGVEGIYQIRTVNGSITRLNITGNDLAWGR